MITKANITTIRKEVLLEMGLERDKIIELRAHDNAYFDKIFNTFPLKGCL